MLCVVQVLLRQERTLSNFVLLLQVTVLPFGAFVDIGTVTDGLVHVSEMAVRKIFHQH